MKVRKNIEGVFLAVAVMTTWAAYATAEVPVVQAPSKAQVSAAADANMQVVVVKAKRLSAAEKAGQN
jgi:hypothetical protein